MHWFLPTRGDSRDVGPATTDRGHNAAALRRRPTLDYLGAVAQAAEQAGFAAVLTPTGSGCEDAWVTCAALLDRTQRLHFLVAFRPGFVAPVLAAQQAASFQRLSGGRLRLNVVAGGDPVEQRAYGDFADHDARYARTAEFLEVVRRCFAGERFDLAGEHVRVEGAGLVNPPDVVPPVYLGGASGPAEDVAARFVDTYLTWGEPPSMVRGRLDRVREKAAAQGRTVRFGIRLHVVSRDTPEQAWAEADRMLAGMPADAIAATQARFARMDSVGQARMASLHAGRPATAPGRWRWHPTCGPASGWSARARRRRSWAATTRSPRASPSTPSWGSRSSCSRATRTSRRRGGSARRCCPSSPDPAHDAAAAAPSVRRSGRPRCSRSVLPS